MGYKPRKVHTMKYSSFTKTTLSLAVLALSACDKDRFPYCIRANGEIVEESRVVSAFEDIDFNLAGTLYISQDTSLDQPTLTVVASENILDRIVTVVNGSTLEIDNDQCISKLKDLEVHVKVKDLEDVSLNGSGTITTRSQITADHLAFHINGSGTVTAEMDVETLQIDIDGSGDVNVNGRAIELDVDVNGSGNIRAFGLEATSAIISISGSGDCDVKASEQLNVNISGSGNVRYRGQPQLTVNTSGSGTVQAD